jgi:hypothetical protein
MAATALGPQSLFSDDDMDFLTYQKNSDSLELSSRDSEKSDADSTPSKSFMSTSSWSPSLAFPDSFEMETLPAEEILAELNLSSLGQGIQSRRLLSQILNSGGSRADHEFLKQISAADHHATHRGQKALQTLGTELSSAKDRNTVLQEERDRLKEMLTGYKQELCDLVCDPSPYSSDPSHYPPSGYPREPLPAPLEDGFLRAHSARVRCRQVSSSQRPLSLHSHSLRAAELYVPLRHDLFVAKKQVEELRLALELSSTSLQTQQEVLARTRRQMQTAAETSRLDQLVAEEQSAKLSSRLGAEIAKRKECEEKAALCDTVQSDNAALRQEVLFFVSVFPLSLSLL